MKNYAIVSFDDRFLNLNKRLGINNQILNIFPINDVIELILSIEIYNYQSETLWLDLESRIEDLISKGIIDKSIYDNICIDTVSLYFDTVAELIDIELIAKIPKYLDYDKFIFVRWIDRKSIMLVENKDV